MGFVGLTRYNFSKHFHIEGGSLSLLLGVEKFEGKTFEEWRLDLWQIEEVQKGAMAVAEEWSNHKGQAPYNPAESQLFIDLYLSVLVRMMPSNQVEESFCEKVIEGLTGFAGDILSARLG